MKMGERSRSTAEWVLTPDGRWRPVDVLEEIDALRAAVRKLSARTRELIAVTRASLDAVRARRRARAAWHLLPRHPTRH